MTWPVWCPTCRESTPHVSNGAEITCTGCWVVRPDDVTILASHVQDMRFCAWCNEKKPVGHDCPPGAVGCTAGREDETTCGECEPCKRAQAEFYARQNPDGGA